MATGDAALVTTPAAPDRAAAVERLALAAILVVAGAGLLWRVSAPWEGNGDWNGALWSLFARNFLRYGYGPLRFGQAYFAGPMPDTVSYYTHHSVLITLVLTELYRLFGIHETVARVAVAAVTVATAGMLYRLVKELFDVPTALFATLVFALSPLTLFFGRMYNHEVYGLFWVVACVLAYRRWTATHAGRHLALVGAGLFVAASSAWPGYYLLPILSIHDRLALGKRHDHVVLRRVLVGATLLALGVYLAHGWWLKGPVLFDELVRACQRGWFYDRVDWGPAFTLRSFAATELARSRLLFTTAIVALAALGVGVAALRSAARRRVHPGDGMLFTLLVFGASHLVLFKQEAMGHEYYLYYLLPGVALAAAIALRTIASGRRQRPVRLATAAVVVGAFLVSSGRNVAGLHRMRMFEAPFYDELGAWLHGHTEFGDRVLVNFHVEGPFVLFYADRDVVERVDALPAVWRARRGNTLLVLRAGRTPHLERAILRHYPVESVAAYGETLRIARLTTPAASARR